MNLILRHLQNAVILLSLVWLSKAAFAASCIDSGELVCTGSKCSERITVNGTSSTFLFYRSFSLGKVHCNVERAIIVIHGTNRNGSEYFGNMQGVVSRAGKTDTALVIAPQFWLDTDSKNSADLYWNDSSTNWRNGLNSVGPSQVSSFAVVDQIIRSIVTSGSFPNLRSVVVTGHSAGGQFAGRYAILGNGSNSDLTSVQFSYAPANPSSFTYMVRERPMATDIRNFAIPDSSSCSKFNRYRYGLENRSGYVGRLTDQQVRDQFKARIVSYLQGTADTVADSDMDKGCEAMLQGRNRYERGLSYAAHIQRFLASNNHKLVEVPGVGHDNDRIYNSAQGMAVLFPDLSSTPAPTPQPQPTPQPSPTPTMAPPAPQPSPSPTPRPRPRPRWWWGW